MYLQKKTCVAKARVNASKPVSKTPIPEESDTSIDTDTDTDTDPDTDTDAKQVQRKGGKRQVVPKTLPAFAQAKWISSYLPTLYAAFSTTDEPFKNFTKNSEVFLALVQDVVDKVWPESTHKVIFKSAIFSMVSFHFFLFARL